MPARQGQVARCPDVPDSGGGVKPHDRLAQILADAFLAGDWTAPGMRERAHHVLAGRHAWARRLAGEVVAGYRSAPADRPRELLHFVASTKTFVELERRKRRTGRFPVAVRWLTEPTSTTRRPFLTPVLDHAGAFAELLGVSEPELLWFADTKGMLRRAPSQRLQHYRSRWVTTPRGTARLLEAPLIRLRAIQRQMLQELLEPIPVSESAHGFVRGHSVQTNASRHIGAQWVISVDLESFFASITGGRIYGIWRSAGYPEPVAHLLTGLSTHATPLRVLREMPVVADSSAAFRLRRRLATPHLPQGSPTSPRLANLCAFRLDRRLTAYAAAIGATYTRYADDLTFSGSGLAVDQRGIVGGISRIVTEEGFVVNSGKTRVRGRDSRQLVTGVVVNNATRVPRPEYDLLRAILHNCVRDGPASQNRLQLNDFRTHLRGRIAWIGSLDAEQGRRLLNTFDRIDWSGGQPTSP